MENKKLTCYVLMISQKFPKTHARAGEPTLFTNKILEGTKTHTIRGKVDNWHRKILKIRAGKAYLSIRKWEGVPYKSPQVEICQLNQYHLPNVQMVIKTEQGYMVGDKYIPIDTISKNDGLSVADFEEWFKDVPRGTPLAIIHFSNSKY